MLDNPDWGLLYISVPLFVTLFFIIIISLHVVNKADAKEKKH